MKIVGYTPREPLPPARVDRWYDRRTRCWVVYLATSEGDQVGEAAYVHSRREALLVEAALEKEITR